MSALPDWVLKYKKKGIYARKTKHGYALYRGHSERVKGKSYPVFRCDEYLGIVTEEHGLTPSKPSVKPGIRVLRYGLSQVVEPACAILRKHPQQSGMHADLLFVRAVLDLEGRERPQGYDSSYLSRMFPDVDLLQVLDAQHEKALSTMKQQMASKLKDRYGADQEELRRLSSDVYAVHVNEGWHLSQVPDRLKELCTRYAIQFALGGEDHEV